VAGGRATRAAGETLIAISLRLSASQHSALSFQLLVLGYQWLTADR
jgi:hypothetical protein